MRPPKPPQDVRKRAQAADEVIEVERTETVEVVLLEYRDGDESFTVSVEFVYTFTQEIAADEILEENRRAERTALPG